MYINLKHLYSLDNIVVKTLISLKYMHNMMKSILSFLGFFNSFISFLISSLGKIFISILFHLFSFV